MNKINKLSEVEKAYISGFLDGDGSINGQIVRRKDYLFKFQIRISITFFQKTSRHWFILWLHKKLQLGTIRKRPDGMSEYTIIGPQNVEIVLEHIKPYLKIKRKQAILALHIIKNKSKSQDLNSFLKCCQLADKFSVLNDSKKRTITSLVVRSELGFFD
uniref:Homing endonuclease LAGLIDADG domain-containing protein n=1 Tax=Trebouxia gelatinosa TaxID=53269 RepID=C7AXU8_9CHLO|nr:hypothetical protein [Trebouxia gelatinosa]